MRTDAMAVRVNSPGHLLLEAKPTEPTGYRNTVVGIVPSDWHLATIGELIDNNYILGHLDGNHGELYPRSHEFRSYGVPYVGANDFHNGKVSFGHCKFLTEERAALFRKGVAKDGDVLFAHNATVGPVALVETKLPLIILSTTATYFRCNTELLNNFYLKAVLQAPYFINQYKAVMAQSTRFQVPITAQRKFTIAVPSIREQRAIATALSDVDALLAELDNLIVKKRDLKQATMQQLFTGKTRLPGFDGKWLTRKLSAIADIRSGGTPSTSVVAFWSGTIPWCTPTDITALKGGKYLSNTDRTISHAGLKSSSAEIIPSGSIIMTTRATIGECAINLVPVTTNQGFKNLIPTSVNGEFLYYLMTIQKARLIQLCAGSTFLEIGKKQLDGFELIIPKDRNEQEAIADVLSDMDRNIHALEKRRAKTAALKQAMMQELLTGRTRLV